MTLWLSQAKWGWDFLRVLVTRKIKSLFLKARHLQLRTLHVSDYLPFCCEDSAVGGCLAAGLVFMFKMPVGCSPLVTMKSVQILKTGLDKYNHPRIGMNILKPHCLNLITHEKSQIRNHLWVLNTACSGSWGCALQIPKCPCYPLKAMCKPLSMSVSQMPFWSVTSAGLTSGTSLWLLDFLCKEHTEWLLGRMRSWHQENEHQM